MKTKRVTAFITMLIMSVTVISQCFVTVFAEDTVISTDGSAVGAETFIDDVEVSGTNSVGDLLASEFQEKQAEQLENNGYNIFSIEMDGNIATVDFQAQGSCTLIVGIYDDSATTMLASGTAEVSKEETLTTVEIPVIAMPDYFYIKAYLIKTETLEPLCLEYTNPNYTQHMQEFFSKTTDDFDEEKVLNFDDDKTNNFAVYSDDVTVIPYEEGFNTSVTYDEETGTYTVENASENIQSLKEGDLFAYDDEVLGPVTAKIGSISVDGTTVTITIGDTDIHEVFDYIRIDASQDLGDAETECLNGAEIVNLNEQEESPAEASVNMPGEAPVVRDDNWQDKTAISYKFEKKFISDPTDSEEDKDKDKDEDYFETDGSISLTASLQITVEAVLNLDLNDDYMEINIDYEGGVDFTAEGKARLNIPFGTYKFKPVPGLNLTVKPSFVFELSAKFTLNVNTKGTLGIKIQDGKAVNNSKIPVTEAEVKGEVSLYIGFRLNPEFNFIHEKIIGAKSTCELGVKVTGSLSESVDTETEFDVNKIKDYHDCKLCVDGDIKFVLKMKFDITFANSTVTLTPLDINPKITDFYYSFDNNEFGFGECPYKIYRIELRVKDSKNNYIEDAVISRKSGAYVKEMTLPYVVSELKEAKSGEDGKLALYFNLGTTELSISKDGYKPNVVRLETSVDEDNNLFINGKQATSHDIILSDITYKVVINVKDSDDSVVPYPEVKYKDSRLHNVGGDKDGVVEFDVKPGDYDFDISQYDCSPCTLSETIDKDSEFDVQLEKLGKGDVKFIIKDRDGNPLQRIMVTSTGLHVGRSNTDGVVILTNMNEGTHKAYLRNSDYTNQKTVEFTVIRDDTVEVEVVMGDDDAEEITTTAETSSDETVTTTSTTTPVSTNIVDSGTCGANLTWTLDDEGTLIISGTGDMYDYDSPWVGNENVKNVIIGKGVTSIGYDAFGNCDSLTSITIPDSVTSIGKGAFYDCNSLESVIIPDSVTSIGKYAFAQCSNITSIVIPNSVTNIGDGTFSNCNSLTSITIPDSVTSIGKQAFDECDNLESITIENPDCEIESSDYGDTIPKTTTIYGYSGSTAQAYAEKYKRKFVALDKPETDTPTGTVDNFVEKVATGDYHAACITGDGSLFMWGFNDHGEIGNKKTLEAYGMYDPYETSPIKIMDSVKEVSLGGVHSACITEDGSLYTWGSNEYGQLGNGLDGDGYSPVKIMDSVKQVSLGYNHSACITEDGSLYMWGNNYYGQIGNGESGNDDDGNEKCVLTPTKIMGDVKQVSLGEKYSMCITEDGSLYTWGNNNFGQLGNGTQKRMFTPTKVTDMENVIYISASIGINEHSSCITEDGSLYVWGYNEYGQIGNGESGNDASGHGKFVLTPTKIMDDVKQVALCDSRSACITNDNSLYTWGMTKLETGDSDVPVKVADSVADMSLGNRQGAYVTEDGSLYTWGNNIWGQLGTGNGADAEIPVKIDISSAPDTSGLAIVEYKQAPEISDIDILSDYNNNNNKTKMSVGSEETDTDYAVNEYETDSLTNLEPDTVYNYYVLYDSSEESRPLQYGNIQYITQFTTDENGSAEINLGYSEITDEAVRMSVPVSPNETPIVSSVTLGDVNQDGMTDASDASQILAIYAVYSTGGTPEETEQQLLSADVNGDGMVDASDASTVLAYYAYLSTGGTVDIETFMSNPEI